MPARGDSLQPAPPETRLSHRPSLSHQIQAQGGENTDLSAANQIPSTSATREGAGKLQSPETVTEAWLRQADEARPDGNEQMEGALCTCTLSDPMPHDVLAGLQTLQTHRLKRVETSTLRPERKTRKMDGF